MIDVSFCDIPNKPTPVFPCKQDDTLQLRNQGYIDVNAEKIGRAVLLLGAGRQKTSDQVDHSAGITELVAVGDKVSEGSKLLDIHSAKPETLEQALPYLEEAIRISTKAVKPINRVTEKL